MSHEPNGGLGKILTSLEPLHGATKRTRLMFRKWWLDRRAPNL
jgi:hypothetical protein